MRWCLLLCPVLLTVLVGCPVPQSQDTPAAAQYLKLDQSGSGYWVYVPSYYKNDRKWPLVITLQGTHGWDSSNDQIREWKALAEQKGLIVVAPELRSVQGILPRMRGLWLKDLSKDETTILGVLDLMEQKYQIDSRAVLLAGFSAGGYPLYYTGFRHPQRFSMLIARSCNTDIEMMDQIELTDRARKMPIVMFWGRDDTVMQKDCWAGVEFCSNRHFTNLKHFRAVGGHLRRPELTYKYWLPYLPQELRAN